MIEPQIWNKKIYNFPDVGIWLGLECNITFTPFAEQQTSHSTVSYTQTKKHTE